MSLKKDKFNRADKKYMKLAINLARKRKGLTGTNPSVGCVIVKKNKIISYGITNYNGRPHAETIALNKSINQNKGSTVYTSLEPCSHYGKTPPCTKSLIKSKIKKLIFAVEDNDLRSFSKSKKILNSKKIITKSGLLKKDANFLYKNYKYNKKFNYPYIIGKLACSANFYILRNKKHITNQHSRNVSHLLRYENQAILTTYKTINSDNPKLTCRIKGLQKFTPIRIIIDKSLKINLNSFIISSSKTFKTYIFHNSKNKRKINFLKNRGVKLIYNTIEKDGFFNLKKIFKKIYKLGIQTLLIESGKEFTKTLLLNNLCNEFYLFIGNKNIKNKEKIDVDDIKRKLNISFKNKKYVNTYLDKDALIHYY